MKSPDQIIEDATEQSMSVFMGFCAGYLIHIQPAQLHEIKDEFRLAVSSALKEYGEWLMADGRPRVEFGPEDFEQSTSEINFSNGFVTGISDYEQSMRKLNV